MRRYYAPYLGRRYLLNKRTNELHDLDNETANCQIDEIDTSNIEMFDTFLKAQIFIAFHTNPVNGCYWCMKEHDKG